MKLIAVKMNPGADNSYMDLLYIPDEMDLKAESTTYVTLVKMERPANRHWPKHVKSFSDWLVSRGACVATDNDIPKIDDPMECLKRDQKTVG